MEKRLIFLSLSNQKGEKTIEQKDNFVLFHPIKMIKKELYGNSFLSSSYEKSGKRNVENFFFLY